VQKQKAVCRIKVLDLNSLGGRYIWWASGEAGGKKGWEGGEGGREVLPASMRSNHTETMVWERDESAFRAWPATCLLP